MMPHEFLPREMGDVDVPTISDEDLAAAIKRFRLVVVRDGHSHVAEMPDPRNTAFTWAPTILHPVSFFPVLAQWTDHTCGYHALFKPSIAEVLAQVPEHLDPRINAFCINLDHLIGIYASGSGHRAITQFGIAGEKLSGPCSDSMVREHDGEVSRRAKPFLDPRRVLNENESETAV